MNTKLSADPIKEKNRRQVTKACFSNTKPKETRKLKLLYYSPEMLKELGLTEGDAKSESLLKVFTGNDILANTKP